MYPRPDLENQRFRKSKCPLTPKDQHVIYMCNSERHDFTQIHDARLQALILVFTSVCKAAEVHTAPPPVLECRFSSLCTDTNWTGVWNIKHEEE